MSQFDVTTNVEAVSLLGNASVTLSVLSGDTLYYNDSRPVSASNNQGSLTAGGASATFTEQIYVVSASRSTVTASWTPQSSGSGGSGSSLIVPTPVWSIGDSLCGGGILNNVADRQTAKLAKVLGTTETNLGVNTTSLMNDNAGPWGKLSSAGSWVTLAQSIGTPKRTRAPYLSSIHVADIISGINAIAQFGPVNAGFLAGWQATTFAAAARLRCGHIVEDNDASITYTGAGWAVVTQATTNSGATFHFTPTNGQSYSITVPADYDGQAIDFFHVVTCTKAWATYTAVMNSVTLATGSTQAISQGINLGISLPFCLRIPTPNPASFQGQTITVTVTNIGGSSNLVGTFDCWGIESNPAPAVVLADVLRTPLGYTGLYGPGGGNWAYVPTDADVQALNAQNVLTAAMFPDGRVISDGADAVINKGGGWLNFVHPDERNAAKIARVQQKVVTAALALDDVPVLGMQ